MAHVSVNWDAHLAAMGNRPGAHQGDVTVHLAAPVEGNRTFTLPSASLTLAAEAGTLIGLSLELPGGRRMFVPGGNVAAVIDAAAGKDGGQ